ncbi:MAG: hypothetical protein V4690_02565 [Patescibacteria group bacterium]
MISIEDFKKIEIKIGHILSAEKIEGSEKLLRLSVDFGEEAPRQVLSGIAKHFENPENLVSKKCAFATNLEPRKMMGLESQAMILAVSGEGDKNFFSLLEVSSKVSPGSSAV